MENDKRFSAGSQHIHLIIRPGDVRAKRALVATINQNKRNQVRNKAACAGSDKSGQRMRADERVQRIQMFFPK